VPPEKFGAFFYFWIKIEIRKALKAHDTMCLRKNSRSLADGIGMYACFY